MVPPAFLGPYQTVTFPCVAPRSGLTLHSAPPPGSGAVLAAVLNIMQQLPEQEESEVLYNHRLVVYYHRLVLYYHRLVVYYHRLELYYQRLD